MIIEVTVAVNRKAVVLINVIIAIVVVRDRWGQRDQKDNEGYEGRPGQPDLKGNVGYPERPGQQDPKGNVD